MDIYNGIWECRLEMKGNNQKYRVCMKYVQISLIKTRTIDCQQPLTHKMSSREHTSKAPSKPDTIVVYQLQTTYYHPNLLL